MAFAKVDFDRARDALDRDIQQAKAANTYDAAATDRRIQQELERLVTASLQVVSHVFKVIDENSRVAKQTMDEMEALIKKQGKKLTDSDLNVIDTMVRTLERTVRTMSEESADSMKALIDWRGEWPKTYRKLFSTPALIDPFIARRKKSIDENQEREAKRTRVNEYLKRAKDLQKQAHQMASRGAALASDEQSEIVTFQSDVKGYAAQMADYVKKVNNSFEIVLRLNPKQKLSAADQKMYADAVKQAQFKTKEARGQLKSFGIKVAAFKKSAAQFGDANRKAAEKAYSEAAKALKQSEADGKKIAQVETKAIKHLDAITKLK